MAEQADAPGLGPGPFGGGSSTLPARTTGLIDTVDEKLVAISQQILSQPIDQRLRQIEAEANFFLTVRPTG